MVLKNCEPELLDELFNIYLKESCFPDHWKVSSMVSVHKNVGERSTAKNYHPVSVHSVVSKVFEKLVNNSIFDHLERCSFFLIFSMVLGLLDQLLILSQLYLVELLGLLTNIGLLELWHLIYLKLLTGFGMLFFFHKFKSYGISGQIFGLIYSFLNNRRLRVVLDGKSSQEYPVNDGLP